MLRTGVDAPSHAEEERDAEALSNYDKEIAFGGDVERGLTVSKQLVTNQISWYEQKLQPYRSIPKQMTLFEATPQQPQANAEEREEILTRSLEEPFSGRANGEVEEIEEF